MTRKMKVLGLRPQLSETEERYWHFILSYDTDFGFVPSLSQIAEHFDLVSRAGAHYWVQKLVAKGYLEKLKKPVDVNYRIVELD